MFNVSTWQKAKIETAFSGQFEIRNPKCLDANFADYAVFFIFFTVSVLILQKRQLLSAKNPIFTLKTQVAHSCPWFFNEK